MNDSRKLRLDGEGSMERRALKESEEIELWERWMEDRDARDQNACGFCGYVVYPYMSKENMEEAKWKENRIAHEVSWTCPNCKSDNKISLDEERHDKRED